MKITGCLLICALLSSTARGMDSRGAEFTTNQFNTPVRVLLDKEGRSAQVRSDLEHLFVRRGNSTSWVALGKAATVSVGKHGSATALVLNGQTESVSTVYFRGGPHPSDTILYKTERFRGALKFSLSKSQLLVTNVLPLEDYLVGSLASEMSASWELEALKAQAVASRTYAMYMIAHPKSPAYDLEKSTQDQVYTGVDVESQRVRIAVGDTRGEYLGTHGKPVKTFYHSRCGGTTETARSVWSNSGHDSKTRVTCPFCQKKPFLWKASIRIRDLVHLLKIPLSPSEPFRIIPVEKTPSGRIALLRLESGNHEKTVTSDQFRSLLGYTRIKSALFDWKIADDDIEFEGRGAGHGVGMCQWGARYLAGLGNNYAQILGHYYPELMLYGSGPGNASPPRTLLSAKPKNKTLD